MVTLCGVKFMKVNVMRVEHGKSRCSAPVTRFCSIACQVAICKKEWISGVGSNPLICHRRSPR